MDEIWRQIVRDALQRGFEISNAAIPGAKLRQIIARIAEQRGETYPPQGHESEKFADFLSHFNSLLTVLPRKGQDILVAPGDKVELLTVPQAGQAQLREDIFEAFTRIPRDSPPRQPWYAPTEDRVIWRVDGENGVDANLVRIPPASMEQELNDRREFASSPEIDAQAKERLLGALQNNSALWAFSRALKDAGLAQKWHFFRFKTLVSRIRLWCEGQGLEWHEGWLQSKEDHAVSASSKSALDAFGNRLRFEGFLEGLSEEDMKRISVPLDVVLKLLRK